MNVASSDGGTDDSMRRFSRYSRAVSWNTEDEDKLTTPCFRTLHEGLLYFFWISRHGGAVDECR